MHSRIGEMSTAEQIREWALQLSPADRASIARDLLDSLDPGQSPAATEAAWVAEIESRAAAYEAGELAADDWQTSLDRARQRLREGRAS